MTDAINITPVLLKSLRELRATATQGEWAYTRRKDTPIVYCGEAGPGIYGKTIAEVPWADEANGELIPAAVNVLVPLIDELSRVTEMYLDAKVELERVKRELAEARTPRGGRQAIPVGRLAGMALTFTPPGAGSFFADELRLGVTGDLAVIEFKGQRDGHEAGFLIRVSITEPPRAIDPYVFGPPGACAQCGGARWLCTGGANYAAPHIIGLTVSAGSYDCTRVGMGRVACSACGGGGSCPGHIVGEKTTTCQIHKPESMWGASPP